MINKNLFFKPTTTYKEFVILDLIEKDSKITQRDMSLILETSVSMVNKYLDELESKGYLIRKYYSTKTVEYFITSKGVERRKYLNIGYLSATQKIYTLARENIIKFLSDASLRGFKNILLYGAGEVAEIIINTIADYPSVGIHILAVIDDDINKQNKMILDTKILDRSYINNIEHDAILISTYTTNEKINKILKDMNYDQSKILKFF